MNGRSVASARARAARGGRVRRSPSGSRRAAAVTTAAARAGRVELSFFIGNTDQAVVPAKALIAAFEKKNPDINIKLELGPQGTELDNMVKTKLATQEMADVFVVQHRLAVPGHQAGVPAAAARRRALGREARRCVRPDRVGERPGVRRAVRLRLRRRRPLQQEGLREARPRDPEDLGRVHGEQRQDQGGRDRPRHPELRRHVDVAAVRPRRLTTTWRRRIPDWAEKYTANQVKYSQEPAVEGFRYLQEVNKAGYLNKNFASVKFPPALSLLAQGQGRPLSGADDHRAEPRDLRPGQDRRRRLLRPAREGCARTPA